MSSLPLVSVVIPTIRRPEIVLRAVQSVLGQTYKNLELIVVVDGPDTATLESLSRVTDNRLRVLPLDVNVGIATVRNIGAANAAGRWVAFLDDDDEWMENKIEAQVKEALRMGGEKVFLSCHYVERNLTFDRILPQRSPMANEPLSEYLFCRRGPLAKSGLLQTSTYFVSRVLMQQVQFNAQLRPHEDLDWLMRVGKSIDRPFRVLDESLSVYHNEKAVGRESSSGDFDFFWNYAQTNRNLFTPEAFSFYIGVFCTAAVDRKKHGFSVWFNILRAMWSGKMTLRCLLFAIGYALFPVDTRIRLRRQVASIFRVGSKTQSQSQFPLERVGPK